MTSEQLTARDRLLEVIRILQEYTDDKTMLTIHDIHGFFPEHVQVGIGAVCDDVQSLENSTVFPVVVDQQKIGLTGIGLVLSTMMFGDIGIAASLYIMQNTQATRKKRYWQLLKSCFSLFL